ncbi:MAG: HD domain-containing phosphohydrolase [Dehalococcoidia bacterium]
MLFVLLLVAISMVAVWGARDHQSRLRALEQTSLGVATLEHVRAQFLLETGILASLVLTGDPALVDHYRLAQSELHKSLERARALARGDPDELAAIEKLVQEVDEFEQTGEIALSFMAAGQLEVLRQLMAGYQGEARATSEQAINDIYEAARQKEDTLASERAAAVHAADVTVWALVGLGCTALLLAVGGAIALSLAVVRPLASLRAKARAIRAGDLEVRANVSGPEEIASLAGDFNDMTDALLKRTDELQRRHQQLSLLHRTVSALSQTPTARGVLILGRKLVSECQASRRVTVWELQDGEVRRWGNNRHRRAAEPGTALSPVRAKGVKRAAIQGAPLLIPESDDGLARGSKPSGADGARLYLPLDRKGPAHHVLEVELAKTPTPTADDIQLVHALGMEIGIALERVQRYEEAREQADRDFVTGLYNHRALQAELERALKAASRRGEPLTVVAMDIDNFKLFNDTYGHSAGDQILKLIAGHLAKLCQDGGLAGRFGNDDFLVILPNSDRKAAFAFARSIQGWLSGKYFQGSGGGRVPIAVSCGVAVFPEDGQKRHELLAVADANLYESKRLGGKIVGRPENHEEKAELRKLGTFGMLESLVTSIDNKDHYTKAHSENVTDYAVLLAQELGFSEQVQKTLRIAGLLHDAGKICIPDRILKKPGPLTPAEYEIVKHHVVIAEHLLVDLPNVEQVREAALHHHERFDGTGYPKGLKGEEIPLLGRIMAVADAFSAMILDRPYRKRRTVREALAELQARAGTQLDPELVEAFVRAVERQEAIATPSSV